MNLQILTIYWFVDYLTRRGIAVFVSLSTRRRPKRSGGAIASPGAFTVLSGAAI
jgi:hypothetical protein